MAQAAAQDFDSQLREFLIDLDGDGRPDAVVQAPAITNRDRGRIQRQAMAGREPSPLDQARLQADMPRLEENSARLGGATLEATGLPSIRRGVGNIAQGYDEGDGWRAAGGVGQMVMGALPGASMVRSAAPVVNALMGSIPRMAATGAAAGVPLGVSEAQAATGAGVAERLSEDPEVQRIRQEIAAKERQRQEAQTTPIKGMNAQSAQQSRERAADLIQGDIDRLSAQLMELEGRVRADYQKNAPFRERYPGAAEALVYGGMGVAGGLPFLETIKRRTADFALGRSGPTRVEKAGTIGKNALLGSFAAFEGSGLPDQIDAASFDPGHPVRERARAALTDPDYYASRVPAAVLTGVGMSMLGSEAGRVLTPGPRNAVGSSGAPKGQPAGGGQPAAPQAPLPQAPPAPVEFATYPSLPQSVRRPVQEAYLTARAMRGGNLPPREGAQNIQDSLLQQGIKVPVTQRRVQDTNVAVEQFTNDFFSRMGRLPTRQEMMSAFTRSTLAVPAAAGAYNALMPPEYVADY